MEKSWNGNERRNKADDHDTLIEVVQILKNHVGNFDKHIIQDRDDFQILNKKADFSTKIIYIAMGGLGVLQILIGLIKH